MPTSECIHLPLALRHMATMYCRLGLWRSQNAPLVFTQAALGQLFRVKTMLGESWPGRG